MNYFYLHVCVPHGRNTVHTCVVFRLLGISVWLGESKNDRTPNIYYSKRGSRTARRRSQTNSCCTISEWLIAAAQTYCSGLFRCLFIFCFLLGVFFFSESVESGILSAHGACVRCTALFCSQTERAGLFPPCPQATSRSSQKKKKKKKKGCGYVCAPVGGCENFSSAKTALIYPLRICICAQCD